MKEYVKPCVIGQPWMARSGRMDKYAGCVIEGTICFEYFKQIAEDKTWWYYPLNKVIIITEQNKHKYQNKKEFLS